MAIQLKNQSLEEYFCHAEAPPLRRDVDSNPGLKVHYRRQFLATGLNDFHIYKGGKKSLTQVDFSASNSTVTS